MLAVVGTVPDPQTPVLDARVRLRNGAMFVGDVEVCMDRGTPALLAASCAVLEFLGLPMPHAFLAGDEGLGKGSRGVYALLCEVLPGRSYSTLAFHYLQPDVDWHNRVLFAAQAMSERPRLIADAGFMYAAKMSGQAEEYDLFTPDPGELAFLADEDAPHPFYTRGFILHEDNDVLDLIARARLEGNAAACLMVKGREDMVSVPDGITGTVSEPSEEAMEAVGGTGDTLTGMASALVESGMAVPDAALAAARANRLAGGLAHPTPGSHICDLIARIPEALDIVLGNGNFKNGTKTGEGT